MKKGTYIIVFLFLAVLVNAQKPQVWVMNADRLVSIKNNYRKGDAVSKSYIDSLVKQANKSLSMKPVSVMDKTITPVSGNKHDYMSQAPYFWYDSSKPNGLPYIRRDGERNPEIYKITDRTYLGRLEEATRILALSWYFTGDEKYAAKATELLKHWFLDAGTKMNPHLEYGQGIPGINTGRGIGIIETRALVTIADAAELLNGSSAWKQTEHDALKQWYKEYLNWLMQSKYGKDEHAAKNNHGTWFFAQAIDFALFTGNKSLAKQLAEESRQRLDSQVSSNGEQPLELDRTNALGYSTMNLQGWFDVAGLAEKAGVDLWTYKTSKGAGIRQALDWLLPYAIGEKQWNYQQINSYNKKDIYALLLQGAYRFNDNLYKEKAAKLDNGINDVMVDILYKQ
ncbi:MAG TPA: alginate lyase family protein [Chitinophagaceae bacterium]|jgi:hypothetical protein|nr:alginate lyase family protein [Chitinophagaceae bacterium]